VESKAIGRRLLRAAGTGKECSKETILQNIVSIYKVREIYSKLADNSEVVLAETRKEPQCPYRLMSFVYFDRFSGGLVQLIRLKLMLAKYPTVNYFGKECKKHSKVKMNHMTTCTLQILRFSLTSITLTSGK